VLQFLVDFLNSP